MGQTLTEWVETFLDTYNGGWKMVNKRLGCISVTHKIDGSYALCFAAKNERTKRLTFIDFVIDNDGIRIDSILGKKTYKEEELFIVCNKVLEVVADYERGCKNVTGSSDH